MKFALTTLYVKDMEKTLAFYSGLLEMPILNTLEAGPGRTLYFLGAEGDVNLELIPIEEEASYTGFSIGFQVEDLPGMKERLGQNGYKIHREMTTGSGTTLCFLAGPNGEEVELIGSL